MSWSLARSRTALAAAMAAVGAAAICSPSTLRGQIQAGTVVRPETTTVGQHFVAKVQVRVPSGTSVSFPGRPDSSAHVDSAGAYARRDSSAGGYTYATATYVLAAWDTGAQALGLSAVTIVTPSGSRIVPLNGFQVYVRSVLPRDTTLRKPKPFRPVAPIATFNWLPWLIAAIAAALLTLLLYAWRRWRQRSLRGLTPYDAAQREFARIEQERLIDAGEPERHAGEMVRVMRIYLAAVIPMARRSATTYELTRALPRESVVPSPDVIGLLDETDRIKFAAQRTTGERARKIGDGARAVVERVHHALQARDAEAARAKAA